VILWPATLLFFAAWEAGLGYARSLLADPRLFPDLDLLLVVLVGLFARKGRVTALLILAAAARAAVAGTPPAQAAAAFLAVGWGLSASRNLLFRNRLPGRLLFGFAALLSLRALLAGLDLLGRGTAWPPAGEWLLPAALTALWGSFLLPLLGGIPPLRLHMEKSRV